MTMRLYATSKYAQDVDVFLDGKQLFNCTMADDDKGMVERIERRPKPFADKRWIEYGFVEIRQKEKDVIR